RMRVRSSSLMRAGSGRPGGITVTRRSGTPKTSTSSARSDSLTATNAATRPYARWRERIRIDVRSSGGSEEIRRATIGARRCAPPATAARRGSPPWASTTSGADRRSRFPRLRPAASRPPLRTPGFVGRIGTPSGRGPERHAEHVEPLRAERRGAAEVVRMEFHDAADAVRLRFPVATRVLEIVAAMHAGADRLHAGERCDPPQPEEQLGVLSPAQLRVIASDAAQELRLHQV